MEELDITVVRKRAPPDVEAEHSVKEREESVSEDLVEMCE